MQFCEPRSTNSTHPSLSEEQLALIQPKITQVKDLLKELQAKKIRISTLSKEKTQLMNKIGKSALKIKESLIPNSQIGKTTFKSISETHFGKNYKRVNDCIAVYRAIEAGADKNTPSSKLIVMGEGLASNSKEKQEKVKELVKRSKTDGDLKFSKLTTCQIRNLLKSSATDNKGNKTDKLTHELLRTQNCISKIDKERLNEKQINILRLLISELQKLIPKTTRPNSVKKTWLNK